MIRKLNCALSILTVALCAFAANAQDFDFVFDPEMTQELRGVSADKAYSQATDDLNRQIESVVKLFSSLAGGGFAQTAQIHSAGGFDVGIRGLFSVIPQEFRDVIPAGELGPFDLGVKDPLEGEETQSFPILQGSVGLPANFEVMGRLFTFPVADVQDGNVRLFGGALKYGLFQNDLAMPAIVLIGGYQKLIVPEKYDFGDVSTISFKGFVSKSFASFTLYGGGGYDRSSLELRKDAFPIPLPDDLLKHDASIFHGTAGLMWTPFPMVRLNTDYNFSEFPNFNIGLSFSMR